MPAPNVNDTRSLAACDLLGTRIAVVLPSLVGGGAERVATDLANHWSQAGGVVSVITIDSLQAARYPLRSEIEVVGLDWKVTSRSKWQAIRNNWSRVRALRQELRRRSPHVVVSFTDVTNVTTLLATRTLPCPTVVSERTDPRHHVIGRFWSFLRRVTYGRAAAIVVQTDAVAGWARSHNWSCPVRVIPNAVPAKPEPAEMSEKAADRRHEVVALGRLSPEKGFSAAVAAFARIVKERFPDWRLIVYGEGPEQENLQTQIRAAGMEGRIELAGWVRDPSAVLRHASLLVLPSRYEGFPNVLLEAMAAGVPAVAFDCESGPREIVRHEVDGLLVPPGDIGALGDSLQRLMEDAGLRASMSERAREVTDRFARDRVFRLWDELLAFVVPPSGGSRGAFRLRGS